MRKDSPSAMAQAIMVMRRTWEPVAPKNWEAYSSMPIAWTPVNSWLRSWATPSAWSSLCTSA